jgi:hypothetical protein
MHRDSIIPIDALWTGYAVAGPVVVVVLWQTWRFTRRTRNVVLWHVFIATVAALVLAPTFVPVPSWSIIVPLPASWVIYKAISAYPHQGWATAFCYGAIPVLLLAGMLGMLLIALIRKQRAKLPERKNA